MITSFDSNTHKIHNLAGPNDVVNLYECVCERESVCVGSPCWCFVCVWDDGVMKSCPGNYLCVHLSRRHSHYFRWPSFHEAIFRGGRLALEGMKDE